MCTVDFVLRLAEEANSRARLDEALNLANSLFEVTAKVEDGTSATGITVNEHGDGSAQNTTTLPFQSPDGGQMQRQWVNIVGKRSGAVQAAKEYVLACADISVPGFTSRTISVNSSLEKLLAEDNHLFRKCLERKFRVCVRAENCSMKLSGDGMAVACSESALEDLNKRLETDKAEWPPPSGPITSEADLRRKLISSLMKVDRSCHWTEYNRQPFHVVEVLCRWLNWYLEEEEEDSDSDSPEENSTQLRKKDLPKRKLGEGKEEENPSLETLHLSPSANGDAKTEEDDEVQIVAIKPINQELNQSRAKVRDVPGNQAKKFALSNSPICSHHRSLSTAEIHSDEENNSSAVNCVPAKERSHSSAEDQLAGERQPDRYLLRPIVIDACNVGYRFGKGKMMDSKGVALVAQHFIQEGHVVSAFLPKNFIRNRKCVNQAILDQLEELNIVIFTQSREIYDPSTGRFRNINNYDDLVIVKEAHETGGVVISCDQYKDVQLEYPQWRETIKNRLLQPSFVDEKVTFSPDGPLGRHGPNTVQTLSCCVNDEDVPRLVDRQLMKSKQRFLLDELDLIVRGVKSGTTGRNRSWSGRLETSCPNLPSLAHNPSLSLHHTPNSGNSNSPFNGNNDQSTPASDLHVLSQVSGSARGELGKRSAEKTEEYRKYMVEEMKLGEEAVGRVLRERPDEEDLNDLTEYVLYS